MLNKAKNIFFIIFMLYANPSYADYIEFLVPKETINYQERIRPDMLKKKLFSINSAASSRYVLRDDQVIGKVAKIMLLRNRPIALSSIKPSVVVEEGKAVKLFYKSGSLNISAVGVPLESGSTGDYIKVRNVDSGRIVSGTIMTDGSVSVGLQ